jgi:DNA-binding MarR family transcriptional regulator
MASTGLEQMICFELYAASRAFTSRYRPALDAHGLTYPQFVALRVIAHRGRLTVRDLGEVLHLDSGTLSPLLRRLAERGVIDRVRGTDDERTVWISLTPQGSELAQRVADLPERLACDLDLSVDEFTQLHHLLSRVRGATAAL